MLLFILYLVLKYTVGHKDGIFFFRSNIETYCFFFGSFITLEQVNDYVMILEYQGEINIAKFCVTSHDLLFGAMEGQM